MSVKKIAPLKSGFHGLKIATFSVTVQSQRTKNNTEHKYLYTCVCVY